MKIIIYLIMSLFILSLVSGQEQPGILSTMQLQSAISPPVAPGTGGTGTTQSECTPFEFKDSTCNGDIRIFTQCINRVVDGNQVGRWTPQSQDCSEQAGVVCHQGSCIREEDIPKFGGIDTTTWIIIGLTIFILWLIFRRKK